MSASLDIVSVGMVTAVGLDAPSSCAAMRARLDGFQETRFVDASGEWLVGAPVLLPRNWVGENRIAHLAAGAICEAFEAVPEARGGTALILCLPEADRPGCPYWDPSALVRRIAEIGEFEANPRPSIIAHGRPSGHVALDRARRLIAAGEAPYVMIAGVDSYLTSLSIDHYLSHNRLLISNNPNGFIPGEAAAAVLCTRAQGRGLGLYGLGLSREPAPIYDGNELPFRADGMTSAYRTALNEAGIELNRLGYRISDLIGEQYWFKQTALASIRLLRERHEFQDLWSPAESVGNIGAAVGPLMLGMAWMAAKKGYEAGNPVLVEASSDAGACGAALLGARPS
ncbi:3-oxoacyl-ACP synthase [Mesorhizobium loti]|nr:3-oxoacyl-ACP synthase [Mesorhizobium loti]